MWGLAEIVMVSTSFIVRQHSSVTRDIDIGILSVRLSRSGIVSKRLNVSSPFL